MRTFAFLFFLACATTLALGQETTELPVIIKNICATVRCGIPDECRDPITSSLALHDIVKADGKYRLIPHATLHGCCPACALLLQENQTCGSSELLRGYIRTQCDVGLRCDQVKLTCVKA